MEEGGYDSKDTRKEKWFVESRVLRCLFQLPRANGDDHRNRELAEESRPIDLPGRGEEFHTGSEDENGDDPEKPFPALTTDLSITAASGSAPVARM